MADHPLLPLTLDLVRAAGRLARDGAQRARTNITAKTTPTDIVTALDREVEQFVMSALRQSRPDDALLAEEGSGQAESSANVRWVLDPIDGTVNYFYGHPHYAVSLAAQVAGPMGYESVVGAVYNPAINELWWAVRGQGAWAQHGDDPFPRTLRGSAVTDLSQAMVGTGFSYDAGRRARQGALVAALLPSIRDIRRSGTASLDLCYAAEGRLDAYYEAYLQIWDGAAGCLIAAEAGLLVTGLNGKPWGSEMTLAAPPALYQPLHAQLWEIVGKFPRNKPHYLP